MTVEVQLPDVEPETPQPFYLTGPAPTNAPTPMHYHEKNRMRAAAFHAKKVYPGPVGDLISRELLSWEDFGYRLGGDRYVMELVEYVLKQPRPEAGG